MKRLRIVGVVLAIVVAACGDGTADTTATTTTTVAPTITTAPTATMGTTTTDAPTTTDSDGNGPWNGIELRGAGIGIADHGQPVHQVLDAVGAVLGEPEYDSGDETDTGCPGTHRTVRFVIPTPNDGVGSRLTLHFDDAASGEMLFTDWNYRVVAGGGNPGAKGMISTPEGITVGSTTDDAIATYGFAFGFEGMSGDVMAWTDAGMIVYADFGDVMVDMATDLSQLHGHVIGIRYPLDACPDELSY